MLCCAISFCGWLGKVSFLQPSSSVHNVFVVIVLYGDPISKKRQANHKGLIEEQQNDYRPRGVNLWGQMKRTKYVKPD